MLTPQLLTIVIWRIWACIREQTWLNLRQVRRTYIGTALGILIAIVLSLCSVDTTLSRSRPESTSGSEPGVAEPEVRLLRSLFLDVLPFATLVHSMPNLPTQECGPNF